MTVSLGEFLGRIAPDRPIWSTPSRGQLIVARINAFVAFARSELMSVRGKNVAILVSDELYLAALLVVLDGFCSQLTIIPGGSDSGLHRSMVAQTKSGVLLSDQSDVNATEVGAEIIHVGTVLKGFDRGTLRSQLTGGLCDSISTRWVLSTSGTSGVPKLVTHQLGSLIRSTRSDQNRGRHYVWGSLYSLGSFAGLQVFLQSLLGGSLLIFNHPNSTLSEKLHSFVRGGCNALSGTPTVWRMVLMSDLHELLSLRRITLGGEIADEAVLQGLKSSFPEAKIVHIYASTEAGVGFVVRDGREGFPREFVDLNSGGPDIRVTASGRLLVRPKEFANGKSQIEADTLESQGFIDTGDDVSLRGDRYFFLGRSNGTINVGGKKVHPQEVESALLKCEGVRFANVTGQRNAFSGSIVKAEIVIDDRITREAKRIKSDAMALCRRNLDRHKVPAFIDIVDSIQISQNGKVRR